MPDVKYVVTVDSTGAQKSIETLDQAFAKLRGETVATGGATVDLGQKSESLWKQFAIGQMVVNAARQAWQLLKGQVSEVIGAAAAAEKADRSLDASLGITGRDVKLLSEHFKTYANELMGVTIYDDEVIKSSQALLVQLTNLDQNGIDRATKGAIGLASVFGMDLVSASTLVAKAMTGNMAALSRYGLKVDENLSLEQKRVALLDKLENMFGRATADADTYSGRVDQLKNAWGEAQEEIGKAVTQNEKVTGTFKAIRDTIVIITPDLKAMLRDVSTFVLDVAKAATDAILWIKRVRDSIGESGGEISAAAAAWDKLSLKLGGFTGVVQHVTDQIIRIGKSSKESYSAAEELGVKLWDSFNDVGERATLAAIATGKFGPSVAAAFSVVGGETLKVAVAAAKGEEAITGLGDAGGDASSKMTLLNTAIDAMPWGRHLPVLAAVEAWLRSTTTVIAGQLPVVAGYSGAVDTAARHVSLLRAELERLAGASSLGLTLRIDLDKELEKKKDQLLKFGKAMPYEEVKKLKEEIAELERKLAAGTQWDRFTDKAVKAMAKIKAVTDAAFAGMDAASAQSQKNKEIALDNEYKKRLAVINATVTNEAKKGAMIIALDAEYDIKRRALQHSAAKQQKAFALAQAIINTAEGMTKALAQGGIFGPILAAVVGAFGAIQVALIAKQPIPLAKGAVFTKPTLLPATTYQVGDAGPGNPEIIAPKSTIRDAVREAMGQLMPQMAFAGAGAAYTINFKGPLIVTNAVLSEAEVNRASGYLFRAVDREAHRRGGRLL